MNDSANLDKLEAGLLSSALSGRQIEQLITTNRELHSVVLELKALLQTSARQNGISTSGMPELPITEPPREKEPIASTPPKALEDFQIAAIGVGGMNEESARKSSTNHPKADFEHDNEQARSRHEKRRQTEILRLKTQVSYKYVSFPSAFYQQEIEYFDRHRKYSAVDPHHWWHRLHQRHHRKLAQGPHVSLASTGEYRDELLDALFDFESMWPEQLLHTLPFRELEHTYGYKLHRVKATNHGMKTPGTALIIEVGRFFGELAKDMSLAHDTEKASHVKARYSLGALYQRCLDRDVLGPLDGPAKRRTKQALDKIYQVLRALNHVANLPEDISSTPTISMSAFILDTLDSMYIRDAAPRPAKLPQIEDHMHFAPKDLCFKTLTELGGLKIAWTNLYTQHLRLIRSSKTLLLFWDVSILGQSPLFSHYPQWMPPTVPIPPNDPSNLSTYTTNSASLLDELQRSYRLIFGNPDGRFLERFFKKHFRHPGDDTGITLHDLESVMLGHPRTRVNISRSSARTALKYYLRAGIPASIMALRPELDTRKHKGVGRHARNWHRHILNVLLRRKTSGKLLDLLNAGPPYPLDFWMHISYLLSLSTSSSLSSLENYSTYPLFGDRLRELKGYMDGQRPKNLRQLFKDRRDTVGYWAFWAVVVVGGLSVVLALVSIALSSAQMVAGFRALGPLESGRGGNASGSGGSRAAV